MDTGFGIYIHYPYCRARCRYCDFFAMMAPPPQQTYAEAVLREFSLRKCAWDGRKARSLYIGGGTPSLWAPEAMGRAIRGILTSISAADDLELECTVEADPGTLGAAGLSAMVRSGVNRLSIGAQSFSDRFLQELGRRHTSEEIFRAVQEAREAGIRNLSLDLIYGLPSQVLSDVQRDMDAALSLSPEHLSVYELMVDNLDWPTALSRDVRTGRVRLPGEDAVMEMEALILERASSAGLMRYEISNFAGSPSLRSQHNQLYWNGGEYLGLGIGAAGFAYRDVSHPELGGVRWQNHRVPKRYYAALERGELPEESREELSNETLFEERVLLGLRQCGGFDLRSAARDLNIEGERVRGIRERLRLLEQTGLAGEADGRIFLTARGLDLHSEVTARLLDERRQSLPHG